MPVYFVTYGTKALLVEASDEQRALSKFVEEGWPKKGAGGRFMPPTTEEVNIRKATPEDHKLFEGEQLRKQKAAPKTVKRT